MNILHSSQFRGSHLEVRRGIQNTAQSQRELFLPSRPSMRTRFFQTCARLLIGLFLIWPSVGPVQTSVQAQAAPSDDWPMYMHDASHSGRTPATAFTSGPLYLQWAYSFGERVEVEAQPVMLGGIIYQGVMNGEMHAIDALTGKKIWIAKPGGPIAHTAAVDSGKVIYGSLDGSIYALSTLDGAKSWSFSTGAPVMSAPAVVNGIVYIGSNDGSLYALDINTGGKLWSFKTGGPVVSSPAVLNGRVYFGSEDMFARAVDAVSGNLLWETQLYGQGMHNTHPVLSDDGKVVIFVTVKPGGTSYVPIEGYPDANLNADPVDTWNNYYQARPKYRTLYYLNTETGADLWDPAARRYSPLPIPYWGLLEPILAPDGTAWFPAPSGAKGFSFELDHDDRLFQINLATGETTQAAGGPGQPEFQTRTDEVGRPTFAGSDYLYTSSEDLSVYHPGSDIRVLYGDGRPGFYDVGSHMHPLSPLPDLHLWRYGGAVAMGGVPCSSVPLVGNNMIYYSSFSWLYAVGSQNKGLNPATSFPKRSARSYELTYPRTTVLSTQNIRAELAVRVDDLIARGTDNPPMAVRWEQPGGPMQDYETDFEIYGWDYELVRSLSEAYPYLSPDQKGRLKVYLSEFVKKTLLNPAVYEYKTFCIVYGEPGIQTGAVCARKDILAAHWNGENPNLTAKRFYGLWAYASATGDWDGVRAAWKTLILPRFSEFFTSYNPKLGFVKFEKWRVGRLDMPAQIEGAQAVRNIAIQLADSVTRVKAQTLLSNLLNGRVNLANFVPKLYDSGKIIPAPIRLNPDGTIVSTDLIGQQSPFSADLIPYSAAVRNRYTDPSQVNWWDGSSIQAAGGLGFMHFPALSEYFPLSSELSTRLRARLLTKTNYYVKSYEVNNPWWWMADLAHHTTGSGEHLYASPTLSWSMFQVKARVQKMGFDALVRQLPEPVSFNARYDLFRMQNLVGLLQTCAAQNCTR